MVAVYNGDPAPTLRGATIRRSATSTALDFELDDPPLLMVEGVYNYNPDGLPARSRSAAGITSAPSSINASIRRRADRRHRQAGQAARQQLGASGIIDQLIWRVPGSEDPHGVGIFARFIGAPDDRNLVDFYFDGGFTFTGMIPAAQRCACHRLRLYRHLRPGLGLRRRFRRAGGPQLRVADRDLLHLSDQCRLVDPA